MYISNIYSHHSLDIRKPSAIDVEPITPTTKDIIFLKLKTRIKINLKNRITYSQKYKGLKINTSKKRKLGAYTAILESAHRQIMALLSYHSRISLLVFQLHLPNVNFLDTPKWNLVTSKFRAKISKELAKSTWGSHKKVIFNWVREVGSSGKAHYHCFVGFKQLYKSAGSFRRSRYTGLWKLLQNCWSELGGGFMRPNAEHTVNRDNSLELEKAFYHISYSAKARDKDFGTGELHKRYSASRLRSNTAHS